MGAVSHRLSYVEDATRAALASGRVVEVTRVGPDSTSPVLLAGHLLRSAVPEGCRIQGVERGGT